MPGTVMLPLQLPWSKVKEREADGGDAVEGGDALLDLLVEGGEAGFRVLIADGTGVEVQDEGVLAIEASIDIVEVDEAADEEAGADEQNQREGDLEDDERFGERSFGRTGAGGAAVLEDVGELEASGAESGEGAEEKCSARR